MPSDDLKTLQEQLLCCWAEVGTTQDQLRLFNLMAVIHDLEGRIGRLTRSARIG
jgi:hypothetical protein